MYKSWGMYSRAAVYLINRYLWFDIFLEDVGDKTAFAPSLMISASANMSVY